MTYIKDKTGYYVESYNHYFVGKIIKINSCEDKKGRKTIYILEIKLQNDRKILINKEEKDFFMGGNPLTRKKI